MRSRAEEIKRRNHERSASGQADCKELADIKKMARLISVNKDACNLVDGAPLTVCPDVTGSWPASAANS